MLYCQKYVLLKLTDIVGNNVEQVNNKVMHNTTTDAPISKIGGLVALLGSMPSGWPVNHKL